jgi:uncharacterized protein DUF2017
VSFVSRRIRRTRRGRIELKIPAAEREVLRTLPAGIRESFDGMDPTNPGHDPAVARLYPGAYLDDVGQDAEFRRLMHGELHEGRLAALDAFEAGIDADELDDDQAHAWLRALNDIRLLLGTRLDVTEDEASRDVEPDDPRAASLALYSYLSWLQEQLVEALSD